MLKIFGIYYLNSSIAANTSFRYVFDRKPIKEMEKKMGAFNKNRQSELSVIAVVLVRHIKVEDGSL